MRPNSSISDSDLRTWLLALGTAFLYWLPAWVRTHETGFGDWQQFLHQWEAARVAIARHGEWPQWNPYHCGGVMLWGDPQAQAYSPFFPLAFFMGSNLALKLSMTVHMAVGLAGAFRFAREHIAIASSAAAVAAFFWCSTGFFAWHLSGGHPAFFPFFFTPWVLIFWREAQVDRRAIAKLALVLTVTLYEGGVYPFPFFALLLLFDGAYALVATDSRWHVIRAAMGVILLTVLSSAFRLVPVAMTMHRYPRPTSGGDKLELSEVVEMFTAVSHSRRWEHEYVWDEYGTFIGWSGLALVILGVGALLVERRWWTLLGALLFGALMLGDRGPYWPWRLLHQVPIFDSLRVPSRFAVLFTFFLALGAGLAVERMRRRFGRWFGPGRLWSALPIVVLLAVGTEMYVGNFGVINRFRYPELAADIDFDRRTSGYHLTDPREYHNYASFPAREVGNPRCYSGMNYEPARRLWTGDKPQAHIEDGEVLSWNRTTNTATIEVRATRETVVTLNQTYAPDWEARVIDLAIPSVPGAAPAFRADRAERDTWGRMIVRVPPGRHRIELRYAPSYFWESLAMSAVGLMLTLYLAFRRSF